MAWIRMDDEHYVNSDDLAEIRCVQREHRGGRKYVAWYGVHRDGDHTCDFGHEYRGQTEVESIDQPVVPAQPGFEVLVAWDDGTGTVGVESHPVIAWRVGGGVVHPVTPYPESEWSNGALHCVKYPDGRCTDIDGAYGGQEEWMRIVLESLQRRRELSEQREKKAAAG